MTICDAISDVVEGIISTVAAASPAKESDAATLSGSTTSGTGVSLSVVGEIAEDSSAFLGSGADDSFSSVIIIGVNVVSLVSASQG